MYKKAPDYLHPNCYLAGYGPCAETISAEHWMSKSLLRELGKAVSVIGIPGMPPGEAKIVGVESLGANILCRNHNSSLNDLDNTALEFFRIRMKIDKSFSKPSLLQTTSKYQIDGILFERWILKVLAGLVLSGASESEGKKIKDICSMNRFPPVTTVLRGSGMSVLLHS